MILSNVNIGTGPSAGDGDPLRTAFNTINQNFDAIESNVNALTNSVSSVAGRQGNVILTTQDIVGINNYATISYVNSQLANAGAANISALQSNVAALQADINTLYGNAGVQSSTLATLTSNAATQAGSLATLTSNAASQAGELTTLLSNAAVQAGEIASLLSNAGSQHEAISSLQANVSTLFANAGAQSGTLTTLTSNAAVQAGAIADIKNGVATFGNVIPSANVTYSLGSPTAQWKELWVSGNTIHIGGATLSVSGGAIQSSLPIAADVTATNITVQGTRIEFASGGYIEESEVVDGNAAPLGYYGIALNSSDDGLISMNALDSNAAVTSSVFVTNVAVQINVANSTPGGSALVWMYDQTGSIIFPDGTTQNTAWTGSETTANLVNGNVTVSLGSDGALTLPNSGAINFSSSQRISTPSASSIKVSAGAGDDSGVLLDSTGEVELYANTNVFIYSNSAATQNTWAFGVDGNITFPDNTVQTTAWTGSGGYSNVQVAAYLPTYTGNVAAGNVKVSSAYRFETGNVTITNESGHATLNPDTVYSATAGVKIGGSGFLLGPNSARNLTLNYGGISGAVGLQGNVTIGTGGSGNLWVQGNVIARDITGGNILTNGSITFADTTTQTTAWTGTVSGGSVTGNVAEATLAYAVNISPVLLNQEYPMAILPSTTGAYGVKSSDGTLGFTFNPARNRMTVGNIELGADGNIKFADGTTQTTAATYGNTQVAQYLPSYSGTLSAGFITVPGTTGKIGFDSSNFAQQTTSNSTQVTSNTTCGNIQLMNINLGAHGVHTVAFACNQLTTNDMLIVKHVSGGITSVYVDAYVASNGLAVIWMRDITGSGTGDFTPMLKYIVIQAPN